MARGEPAANPAHGKDRDHHLRHVGQTLVQRRHGAGQRPGSRRWRPFLESARKRGIQIIHAPSETMDFYKDAPQRKRILAVAKIDPPAPLDLPDPPLPIDDKSGGCDTPDQFYKAWTREHPGLRIDPSDVISDNGTEIYSFLRERGIRTLLVMGVHANMCVLNRTFAIKRMTSLGIRCILVRDLTDAMYNPAGSAECQPRRRHATGDRIHREILEPYDHQRRSSAGIFSLAWRSRRRHHRARVDPMPLVLLVPAGRGAAGRGTCRNGGRPRSRTP